MLSTETGSMTPGSFCIDHLRSYITPDQQDQDGDGYTLEIDCNDMNAQINPGAMEIPNNGIDENCINGDSIATSVERLAVGLRVFPNPASEFLQIQNELDKPASLTISNATGKKIHQQQLYLGSNFLYIKEWPSGLYYWQVTQGGQRFIAEKLVIHH